MDPVIATLMSQLIGHLCVELDMFYEDDEMMAQNGPAIQTMRRCIALMYTESDEDAPEAYRHLMGRIAAYEMAQEGGDES